VRIGKFENLGTEEKRQKLTADSQIKKIKKQYFRGLKIRPNFTTHCFAYSALGLESPIKE
jgi:hypothetical protein